MSELNAIADDLQKELAPHVFDSGLIIEEVLIRNAGRRLLVQISVDSESVLNLDDIASASRLIDTAIETENLLGDRAFTLEVSSRGIDRPLTHMRHWKKNISRRVEVKTETESFVDRVQDIKADQIVFESHDPLSLAQIKNALVQIEFKKLDSDEN